MSGQGGTPTTTSTQSMTQSRSELLGPFSYVGRLNEEYRAQAAENDKWCLEQIEFSISQLLPRVSKREFMERLDALWDAADESYQDFLSMPDV